MNISKAEYECLKKIKSRKPTMVDEEVLIALIRNNMIENVRPKTVGNTMYIDDKCKLTVYGEAAFEQYRSESAKTRKANTLSLLAVLIAFASLVVAILK